MYKIYSCGCRELCTPKPKILKTLAVYVDGEDVIIVVPAQVFDDGEFLKLCITKCLPQTSANQPVFIQAGFNSDTRYPLLNSSGTAVFSIQLRTRTIYPLTASAADNALILNNRYLLHSGTLLTPAAPAEGGGAGE